MATAMKTKFDQFLSAEEDRKKKANEFYPLLIYAISQDEAFDATEARETMNILSKTPKDIEVAVEHCKQRLADQELAKQESEATKANEAVEEKLKVYREKRQKILDELSNQANAIEQERQAAEKLAHDAMFAKRRLLENCQDPLIADQWEDWRKRNGKCGRDLAQIDEQIKQKQLRLNEANLTIKNHAGTSAMGLAVETNRHKVDEAKKQVTDLEVELASLQKTRDGILEVQAKLAEESEAITDSRYWSIL